LLDKEQTAKDDWMRWNMKASGKTMTSNPMQVKNKAKYYFYYCPIYDFWAVGKTREEAWRRLKEDLFLLLIRCSRYESRPQVFREYASSSAEIRA
jgi:predicted RNase H-like HicB family nuclease